MTTTLDPMPTAYADAVDELEEILRAIEDAEVDVDVLADKVRRAAALIEWCRTRIVVARDAVEEVTAASAAPTVIDTDPEA